MKGRVEWERPPRASVSVAEWDGSAAGVTARSRRSSDPRPIDSVLPSIRLGLLSIDSDLSVDDLFRRRRRTRVELKRCNHGLVSVNGELTRAISRQLQRTVAGNCGAVVRRIGPVARGGARSRAGTDPPPNERSRSSGEIGRWTVGRATLADSNVQRPDSPERLPDAAELSSDSKFSRPRARSGQLTEYLQISRTVILGKMVRTAIRRSGAAMRRTIAAAGRSIDAFRRSVIACRPAPIAILRLRAPTQGFPGAACEDRMRWRASGADRCLNFASLLPL